MSLNISHIWSLYLDIPKIPLHDQHLSHSQKNSQLRFCSQPQVFRDVGKTVLLEVKEEGEPKVVPKK